MTKYYLLFLGIILFSACTTSGPSGIFGKKTAHEAYAEKLKSAGLVDFELGRQWLQAAEQGLVNTVVTTLPHTETGYFAADKPRAVGLKFLAKKGEKITISLQKTPATAFSLFMDVWHSDGQASLPGKWITSADTSGKVLSFEVRQQGSYMVRLQPELLKSGSYTLTITNGPSLAFPVSASVKSNVGSLWGVNRDGGARKHEGIDIFAARSTPLVAAAAGTVGAVNENNLGGKVIWIRPVNKDYNLYYAHLEKQLVTPGQQVKEGEVIGLMGNTGNAKSTQPHLHFGIYTNGGAVDPLPFVQQNVKAPARISAPLQHLNKQVRTIKSTVVQLAGESQRVLTLPPNTLLNVQGAFDNRYKVSLPDGTHALIMSKEIETATNAVKKGRLLSNQLLLDAPDVKAPAILQVNSGEPVAVLGAFGDFYYVSINKDDTGWLLKEGIK